MNPNEPERKLNEHKQKPNEHEGKPNEHKKAQVKAKQVAGTSTNEHEQGQE
jgi:hypothetical protein